MGVPSIVEFGPSHFELSGLALDSIFPTGVGRRQKLISQLKIIETLFSNYREPDV